MTAADARRLEQAIRAVRDEVMGEIATLRAEVARASNFQVGFQAISKGLTWACTIVAALAVIYGVLR